MRAPDDPYATFIDPIRLWLMANDLDFDQNPVWPEIVVDHERQTIRVEQFHRDSDGDPTIHGAGSGVGGTYTVMREFPMRVPPDPEAWAAYQYSRPQAMRRAELAQLARDLSFPDGPANHVAVVVLVEQDALMFVTASHVSDQQAAHGVEQLQGLLPGVNVAVVGGFETVMHKPTKKKERGPWA